VPSRYESLVSAARPNDAHGIALQLVGTGKRVLELGAANGHVTNELVARDNSVVAVEINAELHDELSKVTDNVIITDLDRLDLIDILKFERFDVVLAGDVLEHTINPRLVLEQIRQLIAPGGYLVLSVPNVAHGDVRLALLTGEFKYRDVGLLDRTHRTFFTRETLVEFLEAGGFEDLEVFASTTAIGTTEVRPNLAGIPQSLVDYVTSDPLSAVYQFVVRARPIQNDVLMTERLRTEGSDILPALDLRVLESGILVREAVIQKLTSEKCDLETKLRNGESELTELVTELRGLIQQLTSNHGHVSLEFQDWSLGVLAELAEARTQILHLERVLNQRDSADLDMNRALSNELADTVKRLELEMTRAYEAEKKLGHLNGVAKQIEEIHASTTWKIGRFFMLPVRVIRRITRR